MKLVGYKQHFPILPDCEALTNEDCPRPKCFDQIVILKERKFDVLNGSWLSKRRAYRLVRGIQRPGEARQYLGRCAHTTDELLF